MRVYIERAIGLVIISLAVVYASVYLYLAVMGQVMLGKAISDLTGKKVTIGYFSISPDFTFELRDFNIEGMARSKSLIASLDLVKLLRKKLVFKKLVLIEPEFLYSKFPDKSIEVGQSTDVIVPLPKEKSQDKVKNKPLPFGVARFIIKEGRVIFIDQTLSPNSIKITVQGINATIKNIYFYPVSALTDFRLKAVIPWGNSDKQGMVELNGWLNSSRKDVRATLKITDIDAVYLYPYYSYWVDLDKARIEKARLNFSSEIHGLNNEVTADCHLELSDMVRRPLEVGQSEEKASKLTNAVLDRFKSMDGGKVELKFSIKTKMDSPQFGFDNFKSAFENKLFSGRSASGFRLQDTVSVPIKAIESGVKSFTDLSRAMIDGLFSIGKEIKKSTEILVEDEEGKE